MEKTDIKSLDYEELQQFMASLGEKPFRAKQLYEWMHEKLAADLDEMTNLSKGLAQEAQRDNGLHVAGGCRTACFRHRRD